MSIAKKYVGSGAFFWELLATIPLYLIQRFEYDPCYIPEVSRGSGETISLLIKLVRLVRLKRIGALLQANKVNRLAEILFAKQGRSEKVKNTMTCRSLYSVFRLILLTIIITYFSGCIFYMWS